MNQKRLSFITHSFINPEEFPTLRGVIAILEGNIIRLSFFFDGEISESIKDDASVIATEILAQFSDGYLKEEYIRLDKPKSLPESKFWAYINC